VALLVAALGVYGFLTFVSKGGGEAADAQATVVQQVDRGEDEAARSSLRAAANAAKTVFLDHGSYEGLTPGGLASVEPSLTWVDGASPGPSTISVASTPTAVGLAARSASGACFYLRDDASGGTTYGSGATCTGAAALGGATSPSW